MKRIAIIRAMTTITRALTAIVLTLAATSCRRLPLYDQERGVYIEYEHSLDVRFEGTQALPEKMYAIFYSLDTHTPGGDALTPANGGWADIDPGTYDIIAHNFDTPATHVREDSHLHTIEAYVSEQEKSASQRYSSMVHRVKEARARTEGYSDEPLHYVPDHFYVATLREEKVPVVHEGAELKHIKMYPGTIVEPYHISIGHLTHGAEYIQSATVFISGQRHAVRLGTDEIAGTSASISFPISLNAEKKAFTTVFRTFGAFPGVENRVYLLIIDTFGRQLVWDWDVTSQFERSEELGYHIVIDEDFAIPDPTGSGSGFLPVVSDWDAENEHIEI